MKRIRLFLTLCSAFLFCSLFYFTNPVEAASTTSTEETCNNQLHATLFCKKGQVIYYTSGNSIYSFDTKKNTKKTLYTSKDYYNFNNLCISDNKLYCAANAYNGTDFADYHIFSINLNGTKPSTLSKGQAPCILKGYLYFIKLGKVDFENYEIETKGIYRISLKSGKESAVIKSSTINQCTCDSSSLYYCKNSSNEKSTWYAYSPSSKKSTKLFASTSATINELAISRKMIYYSKGKNVYSYNVKTKKTTKLFSIHIDFCTGTLSNQKLYVTDQISNKTTYLYCYDVKTKKKTRKLTAQSFGGIYVMGNIIGYERIYPYANEYNTHLCLRLSNGKIITLSKYFIS